jgi:hypothetical protein
MNPGLLDLLRQQHASGFADVAGAQAAVTIPVADHLVARIANENIPPSAPVREIDLHAFGADRFTVRVRLSRPALLPPISLNLTIEQQPQLPGNALLVLRLAGGGLISLAAFAARFLDLLPPGIAIDGDRIIVNLRTLLEQRGFGDALQYLEHLEVRAVERKFVISARGGVPPGAPSVGR